MRVCGMCGAEFEYFDTIDYDYDLRGMALTLKEVWGCPNCDESVVMLHIFNLDDAGFIET